MAPLALALWLGGPPSSASSQPPAAFELPPTRGEQPPRWAVETHADLVFPVLGGPLCPEGSACPFENGGGLGAFLERRLASGLGLGIAFDLWLLNGSGVYELTVVQSISGRLRYALLPELSLHPFVWIGAGGFVLGDSFGIATGGGSLDLGAGAELELTRSMAATATLGGRLMVLVPFTSQTDDLARAQSFGVTASLMLQFGLVFLGP